MDSTHVTSALVGPKPRLGLATERLRDQLAFSTNLIDNRLCSCQAPLACGPGDKEGICTICYSISTDLCKRFNKSAEKGADLVP